MKLLNLTFILLVIVTVIALYIIGCVGLSWFPTVGCSDNAFRINTVLLNLSYSYIASIIFYILIDLIPRWANERKAFMIFKNDFTSAYSHMNKMIGILKMMAGTSKQNNDIVWGDFAALNICLSKYKDAFVEFTIGKGKEQGEIDCYAFLKYHALHLRSILNNILELPASTKLEREFVTLLIETKKAEAVSICSKRLNTYIVSEPDFPINEFDKKAAEFVKLYLKWGKYVQGKDQYHYELLNEEYHEQIESNIGAMLSVAISNQVDIKGISEVHHRGTFLCYYALPEKYKILIAK